MVGEFLNFDRMITSSLIKFVFWIGSGLTILFGLFLISHGAAADFGGGFLVFFGLITIVAGPFVIRINCELLIIFFKIYEALQDLKKKGLFVR